MQVSLVWYVSDCADNCNCNLSLGLFSPLGCVFWWGSLQGSLNGEITSYCSLLVILLIGIFISDLFFKIVDYFEMWLVDDTYLMFLWLGFYTALPLPCLTIWFLWPLMQTSYGDVVGSSSPLYPFILSHEKMIMFKNFNNILWRERLFYYFV